MILISIHFLGWILAYFELNVKLTSVPAPLANTLFTTAAAASNYYGNDGIIYENLEKSTANTV